MKNKSNVLLIVVSAVLVFVSILLIKQSIRNDDLIRQVEHLQAERYVDDTEKNQDEVEPEISNKPRVYDHDNILLDWDAALPVLEYENKVLGLHSYSNVYDSVNQVQGYVEYMMEDILDDTRGVVFINQYPESYSVVCSVTLPIEEVVQLMPGQFITVNADSFQISDVMCSTVYITCENAIIVE